MQFLDIHRDLVLMRLSGVGVDIIQIGHYRLTIVGRPLK